jgi:hypothetical protein
MTQEIREFIISKVMPRLGDPFEGFYLPDSEYGGDERIGMYVNIYADENNNPIIAYFVPRYKGWSVGRTSIYYFPNDIIPGEDEDDYFDKDIEGVWYNLTDRYRLQFWEGDKEDNPYVVFKHWEDWFDEEGTEARLVEEYENELHLLYEFWIDFELGAYDIIDYVCKYKGVGL